MKAIIYKSSIPYFCENCPHEPNVDDFRFSKGGAGRFSSACNKYQTLMKAAIESAIPVRKEDREKIKLYCTDADGFEEMGPITIKNWEPRSLFPYPLPDGIEMERFEKYYDKKGDELIGNIDFLVDKSKTKEFARIVEKPMKEPTCGDCGKELTLVRPGSHQCDNPKCKSNSRVTEGSEVKPMLSKSQTEVLLATDLQVYGVSYEYKIDNTLIRLDPRNVKKKSLTPEPDQEELWKEVFTERSWVEVFSFDDGEKVFRDKMSNLFTISRKRE